MVKKIKRLDTNLLNNCFLIIFTFLLNELSMDAIDRACKDGGIDAKRRKIGKSKFQKQGIQRFAPHVDPIVHKAALCLRESSVIHGFSRWHDHEIARVPSVKRAVLFV